ncbi:MAG TPA: peptide deformylase [Bacteroidetes bacterium]|nr:peptide deformylase [Bacteroidota bacterium]|tara:strand:+ start:591 stop:1127 length:537 start_codon:yes stop_codon:yes gene_type:complete
MTACVLEDSRSDRLRVVCNKFDFDNPLMDPKTLEQDLKDSMVHHRGIGISACQVGLMTRVFAVGDPSNPEDIVVMFNPNIVDASDEYHLIEEGCLSFPGLFIKVKRPATVRVRYANADGKIITESYEGIPARAILHEYDHLDGITFQSRANMVHLDQAKRQKKKLDKARLRNSGRSRR